MFEVDLPSDASLAATHDLSALMDRYAASGCSALCADRHLLRRVMRSTLAEMGVSSLQVSLCDAALRRRIRLGRMTPALRQSSTVHNLAAPMASDDSTLGRRGLALAAQRKPDALQLCAHMLWCADERWDGHGGPQGLRGLAIPWAARVLSVVNAYASLLEGQMRAGGQMDASKCLAWVAAGRGRAFEPAVVDALVRAVGAEGMARVDPTLVPPNGECGIPGQPVALDGSDQRPPAGVEAGAMAPRSAPRHLEAVVDEVLAELAQRPGLPNDVARSLHGMRHLARNVMRSGEDRPFAGPITEHPAVRLVACMAAAMDGWAVGGQALAHSDVDLHTAGSLPWCLNRVAGILEAMQGRGNMAFQWALEDFRTWAGRSSNRA